MPSHNIMQNSRKAARGRMAEKTRRTPSEAVNPQDFDVMDADEAPQTPNSSIEKVAAGIEMLRDFIKGPTENTLTPLDGDAEVADLQGQELQEQIDKLNIRLKNMTPDTMTWNALQERVNGLVRKQENVMLNKSAGGLERQVAGAAPGAFKKVMSSVGWEGVDKAATKFPKLLTGASLLAGGAAGKAQYDAQPEDKKSILAPLVSGGSVAWTLNPKYLKNMARGVTRGRTQADLADAAIKRMKAGKALPLDIEMSKLDPDTQRGVLKRLGTSLGIGGAAVGYDATRVYGPKVLNTIDAATVESDSYTLSDILKETMGAVNKVQGLDADGNPIIDPVTGKPQKSVGDVAKDTMGTIQTTLKGYQPQLDAEGNRALGADGKPIPTAAETIIAASQDVSAAAKGLSKNTSWVSENKGKLIAAGLTAAGAYAAYKWWMWNQEKKAQKENAATIGEEIGEELRDLQKDAADSVAEKIAVEHSASGAQVITKTAELTATEASELYDMCMPRMAEFIKKTAACGRKRKHRKAREKAVKGYKSNIQKKAEEVTTTEDSLLMLSKQAKQRIDDAVWSLFKTAGQGDFELPVYDGSNNPELAKQNNPGVIKTVKDMGPQVRNLDKNVGTLDKNVNSITPHVKNLDKNVDRLTTIAEKLSGRMRDPKMVRDAMPGPAAGAIAGAGAGTLLAHVLSDREPLDYVTGGLVGTATGTLIALLARQKAVQLAGTMNGATETAAG